MATTYEVQFECLKLQLSWYKGGRVELELQRYDDVSEWQTIDMWETTEGTFPEIAWAECMFAWETYAESVLRSHGKELALPFP